MLLVKLNWWWWTTKLFNISTIFKSFTIPTCSDRAFARKSKELSGGIFKPPDVTDALPQNWLSFIMQK